MLSKAQIDYLFKFCRKHSVSYYDVQVELVDHLANAIESKMLVNPGIGFEQALENIYKSFGNKGFADIVKSKMNTIKTSQRRLMWDMFLSFLRLPLLLSAISCLIAEMIIFRFAGMHNLILAFICFSIITISILTAKVFWNKRKQLQPLLANDFGNAPLSNYYYLGMHTLFFLLNVVTVFFSMRSITADYYSIFWLILLHALLLYEICFQMAADNNYKNLHKQYPAAFD